jgi:hypothetical protein
MAKNSKKNKYEYINILKNTPQRLADFCSFNAALANFSMASRCQLFSSDMVFFSKN